jgi:hypothetical protein
MGSFLLFNEEQADKVCGVLEELRDYIAEGELPLHAEKESESGDNEI